MGTPRRGLWTCSARPQSGDQETDLRRNSGWRRSGRDKCCRGTTTPPWPTRTTTMATATTATMDTYDLCTRTKGQNYLFSHFKRKCSKAYQSTFYKVYKVYYLVK